jgi:transketolase
MSGATRPAFDWQAERSPDDAPSMAAALASVARRLQQAQPATVPVGLAGFLTGLWTQALRYDAADPAWADRDRFVLSDGTQSALLYGLLHLAGVDGMDEAVLERFGRLHCPAAPRPLPSLHAAIEAVAGLPAQGLAASVGLALAERAMAARYGRSLVDHRTWVVASATELAAGLGQEAGSIAGALRLERLAVVFEASSGGNPDEAELLRRFAACGWTVRPVDGGDPADIAACLAAVLRARRPTLIACRTVDADPAPAAQDEATLASWRRAGSRGASARRAWLKRLSRHPSRAVFEDALPGRMPASWPRALEATRALPFAEGTWEATLRGLEPLDALARAPIFLTSTRASPALAHLPAIEPDRYGGRHLACDGQEHGMATVANGLALHGGLLAVCVAPAIAADRIRPALRLAALTGRKLVQLFIDDGLSACIEGAAFQPVEQLAGLRAMPNLFVFRPSCAVEAWECLELAFRREDGPSVIMLSSTPTPRRDGTGDNASARGGYVLADAPAGRRQATLIASGTEVALAMAARLALARLGIAVAVVSLPCWELFERQDAAYRTRVLGDAPRFGIEAAHRFGWERWLGETGHFIGLDGFGASAGYEELCRHVGLTTENVVAIVTRALEPSPDLTRTVG